MNSVHRMRRLLPIALLLGILGVRADIAQVAPSSGAQGAADLSVLFTLAAPPNLPPDQVNPQSVTIGTITAKSFQRSGAIVTGIFDIPAGETPGAKSCTVQFPGPGYAAVNGFTVTAGADSPPAITRQPESRTVSPDATAVFSLTASGTAPLTYQWQKDAASLPGGTGTSLTLAAVRESDEGDYRCIVSNTFGAVTSDVAVLTVSDFPPYPGYNLFSPQTSTDTYLLDNDGNTVHTWSSAYRPGLSAYLLEDGSLLRTANTGDSTLNAGGAGGRVERYDWDGNLTWAFDYSTADHRQHHDVEFLPNGNILVFNNGQGRPGGDSSSIDEIVPPLAPDGTYSNSSAFGPAAPAWSYAASPATNFYALRISGSQRLPNGNTLICDGPAGGYPLVDTGQGTCYNNSTSITAPSPGAAFYGQDAQFDGHQPSFTVSGDGLTVQDNVTGLMWQQTADRDGDGTIDVDDKLTAAQAQTCPDTLNAAGFAGYTDWRLPSIKELYSLIDFRGRDPSGYSGTDTSGLTPFIDDTVFGYAYGDTTASERIIDSQWATTTHYVDLDGPSELMFGVNFADGRIKGYPTSKAFYVLCVRGNTNYGVNVFADNGDGTITDHATGLMWAQNDSGTTQNWAEALAYVETLNGANHLGHNDWRLPDVKALQSILDYTRSPGTTASAAIDPVFNATSFINEKGVQDRGYYWSGTTHVNYNNGGQSASYMAFGRGLGYINSNFVDVHGAGCQRSDPKQGSWGTHGPQGDVQRVYNYVRVVRDAPPSTDSDSDGLTDWDEVNVYGSNPDVADTDGDGMRDGDEVTAGTSPTSAASVLAIEDVAASGSDLVLRWSSASNRTYAIWESTGLVANGWSFVEGGITSTPPVNVHAVTPQAAKGEFYRIRVE